MVSIPITEMENKSKKKNLRVEKIKSNMKAFLFSL